MFIVFLCFTKMYNCVDAIHVQTNDKDAYHMVMYLNEDWENWIYAERKEELMNNNVDTTAWIKVVMD